MSETDDILSETNKLTERIIGCAIEVHRNLGPGLLENVYESALCAEFVEKGIRYNRQVLSPIIYKNRNIGEYRIDLIVEDEVIVELKSVERFDPVFEAGSHVPESDRKESWASHKFQHTPPHTWYQKICPNREICDSVPPWLIFFEMKG